MYLKPRTVKKPNGKEYTYYRLVESYREDGKVKNRTLVDIGALSDEEVKYLARRFAGLVGIEFSDDWEELEVLGKSYFGSPLVVERLMEILNLGQFVREATQARKFEFDLVDALKVMLCAHLFKSGSRAELAVWDWQQKLFWHPHLVGDLEYHHLLRSLAALVEAKDAVERQLLGQLRSLFDIKVDLVFYDLTSSYVEGQADWSEILKRGYSRDKRGDCKQVVIGLVVSQEGFPLTFRVFEGNRVDKKTLKEMVIDLEDRFEVRRCIWVSDAGLFSDECLRALEESEYEYILGMGGSENAKEVKAAIKKAKELQQQEFRDSKFWEVEVAQEFRDEVDQLPRVIVIESEGRQKKTAAIFERRLEKVRQGFRGLSARVRQGKVAPEDIKVEAEKILHGSRVTKYFSDKAKEGKFTWREKRKAVEERKANAGKYALYTNSSIEAHQVLAAYRTLLQVEDAFLVLKNVLDLRPLWHKCDDNIEGHVLLAVWSFLLYKTMETLLGKQGIDISTERALNAIKEVQAIELGFRKESCWKLMKSSPEANRILKALGLPDFRAQFHHWAKDAPPYHYVPRSNRDLQNRPTG